MINNSSCLKFTGNISTYQAPGRRLKVSYYVAVNKAKKKRDFEVKVSRIKKNICINKIQFILFLYLIRISGANYSKTDNVALNVHIEM